MNKIVEAIQDKVFIVVVGFVFGVVDLYISIKGYYIVYKEKYIDRK